MYEIFDLFYNLLHADYAIAYRLDCETSGILLFAKTGEAAAELCRQFREREVKKLYIAEVVGNPGTKQIDDAIGPHKDPAMKPRYVVDNVSGKASSTLCKSIRSFRQDRQFKEEKQEMEFSFDRIESDETILRFSKEMLEVISLTEEIFYPSSVKR